MHNSSSKCTKCNKVNNEINKFCIYCGAKMLQGEKSLPHTETYRKVLASQDGVLVALLAKVAKSDGKISQDEAHYMSSIYDDICAKNTIPKLREILKQILSNEKETSSNIKELCDSLLKQNINNIKKEKLISSLIELAHVDGEYHEQEENLIVGITYHLHLEYSTYKSILQRYVPKKEQEQKREASREVYLTIDKCYEVLKSEKTVDNITLKKNYRNMVKAYHTDILKGKDLPSELIDFAEEKLKSINFAYEKLKKYRNF